MPPNELPTYTVKPGSAGEVMVITGSGRVEFMSFWQFCRFVFFAFRATGGRAKFVVET